MLEKDFEYPNFGHLKESDEYLTGDQRQIVEICKKYFGQEKNDFIDHFIRNDNFWRRKQERGLLHTLAWDLADDPHSGMDVPNTLRAYEAGLMETKPEFFKDDEFVDTTKEASVDDLLRIVIERIDQIDEKLEGAQTSDLLEHQKGLYREIIGETQRRLEALNQRIRDQLEESSVEYFLSPLSQRLQKIEETMRRPSWSTTLLLVIAAAAFGAWLFRQ